MTAKTDVKIRIEQMEVGESVSFDIARLLTVRTYASSVGLVMNRHYKTTTDREAGTITVTREN